MALPNHEDLMRLKSFIEFVMGNPTILNYPQLDFVKKFIENFGGKVPEGEFKMPGGGKCPFGGNSGVKSETKPSEAGKEFEPDAADVESDSESEIELDMEVGSCHDLDESHEGIGRGSNAIFLKETKEIRKSCRIKPRTKKELSEDEDECNMDEGYEQRAGIVGTEEEDPINTTGVNVIIKTEFDGQNGEMERENTDDDISEYQTEDEIESDDGDDHEYYNVKGLRRRHIVVGKKAPMKQKTAVPSTRLTRTTNQRSKEFWKSAYKPKITKKPKPITCGENCKQKCRDKIHKEQRQYLCTQFWALDFIGRKNYILRWVETRKVCTIRRSNKPTRAYTNRYFLHGGDGEKKRVCHSFFLSTLSVSGYVIKNAFKDSDGKGHYIGYDKRSRKSVPPALPTVDEGEELKANHADNGVVIVAAGRSTPSQIQEQTEDEFVPQAQTQPEPKQRTGWNKGKKLKKDHVPQPVNCDESCQMKCTTYFTEDQRSQMCATFWTMDYKRRKDFVLSRIETREVECITAKEYRKTNRAIRSCSNRYFFRGARGDNVRVCAKFFTATLCIGRQVIHNALKNADRQTGAYIGEDKRGRHTPGNKISDEMLAEVKRHIESYPTWVPHKNYKTRFLHSSLNIRRMYREYQQTCVEQQRKFVGKGYFSTVFHKQCRLAFLKPTSKHDHKVSAVKRDIGVITVEMPPAKKVNTNISDYTGEEGGFWLRPHTTDTRVESGGEVDHLQQDVYASPNRVQIEENLQLHTLQSYTVAAPNYLQPTPGEQGLPQRDSQVDLPNFAHPAYEQYNSVFRML